MVNRIVLNETSYFGRESRYKLVDELKTRGFKKVLFVTDYILMENGVAKKVAEILQDSDIDFLVY